MAHLTCPRFYCTSRGSPGNLAWSTPTCCSKRKLASVAILRLNCVPSPKECDRVDSRRILPTWVAVPTAQAGAAGGSAAKAVTKAAAAQQAASDPIALVAAQAAAAAAQARADSGNAAAAARRRASL